MGCDGLCRLSGGAHWNLRNILIGWTVNVAMIGRCAGARSSAGSQTACRRMAHAKALCTAAAAVDPGMKKAADLVVHGLEELAALVGLQPRSRAQRSCLVVVTSRRYAA